MELTQLDVSFINGIAQSQLKRDWQQLQSNQERANNYANDSVKTFTVKPQCVKDDDMVITFRFSDISNVYVNNLRFNFTKQENIHSKLTNPVTFYIDRVCFVAEGSVLDNIGSKMLQFLIEQKKLCLVENDNDTFQIPLPCGCDWIPILEKTTFQVHILVKKPFFELFSNPLLEIDMKNQIPDVNDNRLFIQTQPSIIQCSCFFNPFTLRLLPPFNHCLQYVVIFLEAIDCNMIIPEPSISIRINDKLCTMFGKNIKMFQYGQNCYVIPLARHLLQNATAHNLENICDQKPNDILLNASRIDSLQFIISIDFPSQIVLNNKKLKISMFARNLQILRVEKDVVGLMWNS